MDLLTANAAASVLTLVAFTMIAFWYLAPALIRKPLAAALTVLLWFHAFRYVALQIFSAAAVGGLSANAGTLQTIVFGDLATAMLALITIAALRRGWSAARFLVWATAIIGTIDLVSATVAGVSAQLLDTASNWSWFILAVYVPVLWVTAVMIFWQLFTRRNEPSPGSLWLVRRPPRPAPTLPARRGGNARRDRRTVSAAARQRRADLWRGAWVPGRAVDRRAVVVHGAWTVGSGACGYWVHNASGPRQWAGWVSFLASRTVSPLGGREGKHGR